MAVQKIAFTLEFQGSGQLTKQLSQVELDLGAIGKQLSQVKKDIDTFNNGTEEQRNALIESGKSLKSLTNDYERLRVQQVQLQEERKGLNRELRDQVKAFNEVENAVPEDSLIGLRRQYKELRKEINLLSTEERESDFGQELIKNAAKIKQEIIDIGQSVNDGREGVGLYLKALQDFFKLGGANNSAGGALSGVLGDILGGGGGPGGGGGLGGAISKATAAFGPYGAALSAVGSGVVALGSYIVSVTKQFEELNNAVGTTTGLVGEDLTRITVGIKSIAETFDADFNETLRAANALTKEVTGDFDQSLKLIEQGFLAGANGSQQFLDNIIEYSAQIGAAGASGEEFIEILVRAEREGIFSDKGVDLVKEFGLRVREQTTATTTALEQAFGAEFTQNLFDRINDGSVNTVEALTEVSGALKENQLTAKQTQQVIADVFGGPGEDAGLRFIQILSDVDGNLDKLIDTTDAFTRRQLASLEASRALNEEQQILAAQFAGTTFDLETLTNQAKAFGTSLLNDVLLNIRAVGEEFKNGNIAAGIGSLLTIFGDFLVPDALEDFLGIDLGARKETVDEIVRQDAEALREIEEGEADLAAQRRQNAVEGSAGIQQLRTEQALLREEIDRARVAGEDYSDLQDQLTAVSNNLSKATSLLNGNIQHTKAGFKEIAAEGSIEQLTERVRELQEQISKASPNEVEALIQQLNNAELDLSNAQKQIEDFKEQVREANIELLPVEEQVKIIEKGIELRRELELQAARTRIEDEERLQTELALINARFDKEVSETRIKQFEEETADYVRLTNEIVDAGDKIGDLEIKVTLQDREETIRETERLTTQALQAAFENEEELQERIQLLRLQTDTASLQARLELEDLSAEQRFDIEEQLLEKTKQLREAQARADLSFAERLNDINQRELERTIVPEFNPDDVEASLEAIKEYENQRTIIEQEAELERLQLRKELLERQGEDTLEIEQEIAEQSLQLEQERNAKLIEEAEKRAKAQADFAKKVAEAEKQAFQAIGESLGNFLISSAEDSEQAFKNLAQGILGTVIDLITQQATLLVTQSFAQPDSVLTFGATGATRVALITGLIQGASAALKNILTASLNEQGNVLQGGGDLPGGGIFAGRPHSQGGVKFLLNAAYGPSLQEAELDEAIIKATSTQKWKGLLSAINVDGGGRNFSADTGMYLNILRSIKPTRYATGGQLNGSTQNIPMLVDPSRVQRSSPVATISSEDMAMLAEMVGDRFSSAGSEFAALIVDRVVAGLDESNRLKEREAAASANAEL